MTENSGHEKRRNSTRSKIILAAHHVMSQYTFEQTTIDDIVLKAGVGKGSFYNHFASKEALYTCVMDEIIKELSVDISGIKADFDDPARFIAISLNYFIYKATVNPEIGGFVVNAPSGQHVLEKYAKPILEEQLNKGEASKRFLFVNRDLFFSIFVSATVTVIGKCLEGVFSHEASKDLATYVLIAAGLSREEATKISHSSMPELFNLDRRESSIG